MFSIIVVSNRCNELLDAALSSIEAQVFKDFEIILVIDSEEQFPHLSRYRPLYTGGGRGLAYGRNLGLASASGTHVLFLDDDDLWEPSKLGQVYSFIDVNPDAKFIVNSSIVEDYSTGERLATVDSARLDRYKSRPHALSLFIIGMPIANSSCWCVRADIAKSIRFNDRVRKGVDGSFYFRYLKRHGIDFHWLGPPLTRYRINHPYERITDSTNGDYEKIIGDFINYLEIPDNALIARVFLFLRYKIDLLRYLRRRQ